MYSFAWLYEAYDRVQTERARAAEEKGRAQNALQAFFQRNSTGKAKDGFARMQECRVALDTMDRMGWQRSFHQRMFHDNFIRACARLFFKTEPRGVRPGTPVDPGPQRMGQPLTGGADLDAAALRKDHLGEHVCGGARVQRAGGGDLHLLDMQADQPEAAAQRAEVPEADLCGDEDHTLQGAAVQHGGGGAPGAGGAHGRPHREFVSQQGDHWAVKRGGRGGSEPGPLPCCTCRSGGQRG
jgi:hypothetical protein